MEQPLVLVHWFFRSLRSLSRDTAVSLTSVICWGLSVATAATVFVIVDAILFRPFPYPEPSALVRIYETHPSGSWDTWSVSAANFLDWKEQNEVFEKVAAYRWRRDVIRAEQATEAIRTVEVGDEFLSLLGITPVVGRAFESHDRETKKVVILTHALSQTLFASKTGIVEAEVSLSGEEYAVVGVLRDDFRFPDPLVQPDALIRLELRSNSESTRNDRNLQAIARLRSGTSLKAAQLNMNVISERLEKSYPDSNRGWGSKVVPTRQAGLKLIRPRLLLISVGATFVVGVGLFSVLSLILARFTTRVYDFAVRLALGSRRRDLIASLIGESTLLALVGGLLGLVLTSWFLAVVRTLTPEYLAVLAEGMRLDARAFLFSVTLMLAGGALIGLLPASRLGRAHLGVTLSGTTIRFTWGISHQRLRKALVVSQLAMSTALLTMSGLVLQSLAKLRDVELGFEPKNVLTMKITVSDHGYSDRERLLGFYQDLLNRVQATPGIEEATLTTHVPFAWDGSVRYAHRDADQDTEEPSMVSYMAVGPEFHKLLQIPLLRGRYLSTQDDAMAPQVALINDVAARVLYGGENPIGKSVTLSTVEQRGHSPSRERFEIVGVATYARHGAIKQDDVPVVYVPFRQAPEREAYLAVRASGDSARLVPAIRELIEKTNADFAIYDIRMLEELTARAMAEPLFNSSMLGGFSLVALLLVLSGVFAQLYYSGQMRFPELAVRVAFGATPHDVGSIILAESATLALIGCALGLAIAWNLRWAVSSQLYGIAASDPRTFATAAGIMLLMTSLAAALPALRAARIDPLDCLRVN